MKRKVVRRESGAQGSAEDRLKKIQRAFPIDMQDAEHRVQIYSYGETRADKNTVIETYTTYGTYQDPI